MKHLFNSEDSGATYDQYVGYDPDLAVGMRQRITEVLAYTNKEQQEDELLSIRSALEDFWDHANISLKEYEELTALIKPYL